MNTAMTTQKIGENRPKAAGGAGGEVVTPQSSEKNFGIAKLNIKPKNPGATVVWALISSSGRFPIYPTESTEGRVKIIKKDDEAVYIQFLKNPGFFKLLRVEEKEKEGAVDIQKFDDPTVLLVRP